MSLNQNTSRSDRQTEIARRLLAFVDSDQFGTIPEESLSAHWKHHHQNIQFDLDGRGSVTGQSGVYTPSRARTAWQKIGSLIRSPGDYSRVIVRKLLRRAIYAAGMGHEMVELPPAMAFDEVMSLAADEMSRNSPDLLDFSAVANAEGAVPTAEAVTRDYLAFSGGVPPNTHIYYAYYYMNILLHFDAFKRPFSFLEIGAGNGNLAAQLLRHRDKTSYIVDLPRTLVASITHLTKLIPDLTVVMPHEAEAHRDHAADLIFLTPCQLDLIPENSCSLAVNTQSFQEMTRPQIATYFELLSDALIPGGLFFTSNRVEKAPVGPAGAEAVDLIRFSEFPWPPGWSSMAYEICPLNRLLSRNNAYLRLCQKPA